MALKFYNIMGQAYTDMLKTSTGKALTTISTELGFNETYLRKTAQEGNKIRIGVANQIEAIYGIPISPYIVPEYVPEPKTESEEQQNLVTVDLSELLEFIRHSVLKYMEAKQKGEI